MSINGTYYKQISYNQILSHLLFYYFMILYIKVYVDVRRWSAPPPESWNCPALRYAEQCTTQCQSALLWMREAVGLKKPVSYSDRICVEVLFYMYVVISTNWKFQCFPIIHSNREHILYLTD